MTRLFNRLPVPPVRRHPDTPDQGGSGPTDTDTDTDVGAATAGDADPPVATRRHYTPRSRLRSRSERLLASRSIRDAIVSLAGLVGRPVRNQGGPRSAAWSTWSAGGPAARPIRR